MNNDPRNSRGLPILNVRNLIKVFSQRSLFFEKTKVTAVDNVDMALFVARTLALVGETGSGKSTLARCLVRLEEATSGEIWFDGMDLRKLAGEKLRATRRHIQLIFQEPMSALDPRFSALEIVSEPLVLAAQGSKRNVEARALELMEDVGLPRAWARRGSHQFSGGQKQRLALARALAADPKVIIMDEALSGLDLSVQAQMINLMLDIQAKHLVAYLFITHDLSLLDAVADEIAVMKKGSIVEHSEATQLLNHPRHPYTQSLLATMRSGNVALVEETVATT
jgi:ABC-type oligopeptide transport system ATPase subunit